MLRNQYGGGGPGRGYGEPDDLSDDSSTPLTQEYNGNQRTVVQLWDSFRNFPPKNESGSMSDKRCFEILLKITKVLVYMIVFTVVLGGGVIAKGTILFMTSQLKEDRVVVYCNRESGQDRHFVVALPEEERIAWICCITIAFAVPEFLTLIKGLGNCLFKSTKKPRVSHFLFVLSMETFHAIGSALMFLVVLPDLDVVKGAMITNCVCFMPGVLRLLSRFTDQGDSKRRFVAPLDVAAFLAQATGFFVWALSDNSKPSLWLLSPALLLVSCRWWENYVSVQSSIGIVKSLGRLKEEIGSSRYFTYIFVSLWRMLVFLIGAVIILHFNGNDMYNLFSLLDNAFHDRNITVIEVSATTASETIPSLSEVLPNAETETITADIYAPFHVLSIQIVGALFAYQFGKFACKILIQGFGYAFPVNATVPVSISLLIAACGLRNSDPCTFHGVIPDYLSFESPPSYSLHGFILQQHAWVWLLWLFSQIWITLHIWTPKCERLASTRKLFVIPMYDALLVDQSMGLNRRRDDQPEDSEEDAAELETDKEDSRTTYDQTKNGDHVPRIYACATMWHEDENEMMGFLKSILSLDEDQCARRVAQKYLQIVDPDYYELETHIFFDDAFRCIHVGCKPATCKHDNNESQVNEYVIRLVETLHKYAEKKRFSLRGPKKYPTPYGGRLVWTLPGNTKMIAHLKDKKIIRHKKRWSQVMYMYYLLGHRLMELPINVHRKEVIAKNTYLLTLDGDIDFQPDAVKLLIDLMKKNDDLGAACGRIHPVGSGPLVWFQMFEYAIGHWLQKSTEHVIGCVLCSPGCFSLFRAKALMDDNVMRKYTTPPTEATHYVQYDQGEDRWLCTLLLQRGYRVEYSAASDAYTNAPSGFNEFYNQRRRWIPSTMANIIDLLSNSKHTIRKNNNISLPYIWYQILLMGSTVLGPGTIFLILVGAFVAAFNMDNWTSFYYNIIPVTIFMVVCYTCKSKTQLFVAAVISVIYGLLMVAVLVAIMVQIADDGWVAPSTLLFFMVAGQLIIAGLFHPQELRCLLCGLIYYVTVPSMYMLLIIYSLFNLHDVSWGTREVRVEASTAEEQREQMKSEKFGQKGTKNSSFGRLHNGGNDDDNGSVEFSCAGLFKCMLCTHGKPSDEKQQLVAITETLNQIGKRLETIDRTVDHGHSAARRRTSINDTPSGNVTEEDHSEASQNTEANRERNFLVSPYWLEDDGLRKGEVDFLSTKEELFWRNLLGKYLHQITAEEEDKDRISKDLKTLRNQTVFKFFMLNALFVLIIFLMQLNKDELHIKWPLGIKYEVTYDEVALEVHITKEHLQLEPIGCVFILTFALILFIQFIAMLFHRFDTLAHILANIQLDSYCFKKADDLSEEELLRSDGVELVKKIISSGQAEQDPDEMNAVAPGRRRTIVNIENNRREKQANDTLESEFHKRWIEGSAIPQKMSARMSTRASKVLQAFEVRRNTIINERRKSQMRTVGGNDMYDATGDTFGATRRPTRSSQLFTNELLLDDHRGEINRGFETDEK